MNTAIRNKIKEYNEQYIKTPKNVLEIGSMYDTCGTRCVFNNARDYCGVDEEGGPSVDIVADYHRLDRVFEYNPDVILCIKHLEKDTNPIQTIDSAKELLAVNGFLVISTLMSTVGRSRSNRDFLRFLPDFYLNVFFKGLNVLDLCEVTDGKQSSICGIAMKAVTI